MITETEVPWKEIDEKSMHTATTFLFYGGAGSGKTYLLGQFPNPLILACDPGPTGGARSALLSWERLPEGERGTRPKIAKIFSYDQLNSLLPKLEAFAGKSEGFTTLAVDSLSYLQRIIMQDVMRKSGRETPQFADWGLSQERLRNLISKFADFKCFTVLTATEQIQKDEIIGKLIGSPNLPGKLAIELPQACDVVCRLFVVSSLTPQGKVVKYKFSSTPDDIWVARDRTGTLPIEGDTNINSFKHLLKLETETEV